MPQTSDEFIYEGKKATKTEQLQSTWPVYEDYEVVEEEGRLYIYAPLRPAGLPSDEDIQIEQPDLNLGRLYSPLQDVPDLFIRFTSLMPRRPILEEEMLERMLEWVRSYGVLGSHAQTDIGPADDPKTLDYSSQRDRVQSVLEFWRALQEATHCLRLYQAAAANQGLGDEDALSDILSTQDRVDLSRRDRKKKTVREQREVALVRAQLIVHAHISQECYPVLSRQLQRTADNTYETAGFFQGWGSRSLLGAMYLQMMWLMTTASNVKQCKGPGCLNIITYDPPQSPAGLKKGARGKYRTRMDKRFCSKNCVQKWRYHNVIKPRQQAEKG